MIDPGRPFFVSFADLIERLEERVRSGVERPEQFSFIFQDNATSYGLPGQLETVTRVSGLAGNRFRVFESYTHYRVDGNRLLWVNDSDRPDSGTRVEVEYTVRETPPGLTDFNEGSVVGTLTRTLAREFALMYAQMDEAYRRAFIDVAEGKALDNVVALLGVARNPAQPAAGEVTFVRKSPTAQPIIIPKGTRVADATGRLFLTQREGVIPALVPVDEQTSPNGTTTKTSWPIEEVKAVWPAAAKPDTTPSLAIQNTFGPDGKTITLTAPPPAGSLLIRYTPRVATVPIQAVEPGPEGNVNAGTITVMPTPPRGVDGMTNEKPTAKGQAEEPDDRLRDRAKHALERAGNATVNAIRFAVLDVDGVDGCEVSDHNADDAVPLGEVRVRYSGGRAEDVRRAVEMTRAAGILARLEPIQTVLIGGRFVLVPGIPPPTAAAPAIFVAKVVAALNALPIGGALSLRRLNALAYEVPGLAEVVEAQLDFQRPETPGGSVADPFLVANTEIVRPDEANLGAVLLARLEIAGHEPGTGPNNLVLSVNLRDTTGATVTLRQFSLSVSVAIRAYSSTAPDQAPERIANVAKTLEFTDNNTSHLTITSTDLAGFRPADHDPKLEFVLNSPPYPGLVGITEKIAIAAPS